MNRSSGILKGQIVKSTGSWYELRNEAGAIVKCRAKGKMRTLDLPLTNPIAVGDWVEYQLEDEAEAGGIIQKVLPRTSYLARQSTHKRKMLHLLASNIDQALLIITLREPDLKPGFIDRFLLTADMYSVPVIIAINKMDIYEERDVEQFMLIHEIYKTIGVPIIPTSSVTGRGIGSLREALTGKTTLLSGQSGVGKSSLVNAIQPGLSLRTGDISNYSGKGQHTTTFAEMFPLAGGGNIIDTPGIKELGFIQLEKQDVAHNFREFFAHLSGCRYHNCLHITEPECAVKEALRAGKIHEGRYMSYLSILEGLDSQNYWERETDW